MPDSVEVDEQGSLGSLPEALAAWPTPDALIVLLVTDLQGFTPLLVSLGDVEARRLIRAHNAAVRSCLHLHHGAEIAHLGDGVLAAFRSVRGAIACATAIQRALPAIRCDHAERPLLARIGLHAGEPLAEDGRLFGVCVNTAFRICDAASAGCVLASDVIRQLAGGHKVRFEHRGRVALKGLDQPVRLHEVVWDEARARSLGGLEQRNAELRAPRKPTRPRVPGGAAYACANPR